MNKYQLTNSYQINIDYKHAHIAGISVQGKSLAIPDIPYYAVKLRNKKGEGRIITAKEGRFVSFRSDEVIYAHEEMMIGVRVEQKRDRLHWRISVENRTDDMIEWVELMSLGVHGKLRDEEGGKGEIVFPYNEGCLVTNMDRRNNSPFPYMEPEYPSLGKYSIFPNMISSQFLAYIVDGAGIYLGMHDEQRATKHIDFKTEGDAIKLQMRVYCDTGYGEDYKMPFDCVMTVFEGDWHDACEIYREWFIEHLPQGLKRIADTDNLPSWYEESPIVVTYPVRGKFDTDVMDPNRLFPYQNAIPYLREIATETESKIMPLLMHWEGTAPWAPPYVWPPYGGEELFGEFLDSMHNEGMPVGLYCSGMGWTQQSNLIAEYNREAEFEKENLKEIMCADSDGHIESAICREQRRGYDLCPACDKSKEILTTELTKLVESGVDYVQVFDQNHGGNSYFCYSDAHGHSPGPGAWQARETMDILQRIEKDGVLLGCESAAAEPFLSALKFSDNRYELNYYIGLPIPLYSYLYHEYVNNFMGNQICMMLSKEEYNYPFRVAYSFAAGDMLTVVLTDSGEVSYCWGNECFTEYTDKKPAYEILKNLNAWRQGAGKDFLHCGKMVKPMPICCGKNSFMGEDGYTIIVDEVLTTAYEYQGDTMQFVINYNSKPVSVSVTEPVHVYENQEMTEGKENITQFEIPALSAVAICK